jgi:hypothetical protein
MKNIILNLGIVVLSCVGTTAPIWAADSTQVRPKTTSTPSKAVPAAKVADTLAADSVSMKAAVKHHLVVYYFHGTQRCANCIKIEAYTKEVIDSTFATQLKDSTVVWNVINTDEDTNKHYREDYKLYTKSVVLSDLDNGKQIRWKNLDKIWDYLGDKPAFLAYIRDEVAAYLKAE